MAIKKKPPAAAVPLEEQDQSIKARKSQLFDDSSHEIDAFTKHPFALYLKKTPGTPFSQGLKATFWAVGAIVFLLFLAAILSHRGGRPAKPSRSASINTMTPGRLDDPAALNDTQIVG